MVLNLDKCIGCHTCSVTCKNVWSSREGMGTRGSITWRPNRGCPKNWEDQDQWQGGWIRGISGKLTPRLGNRVSVLSKIFANPVPAIDDYYEPFTYDYQHLHNAPEGKYLPTARPRSLISGERMDKISWGPNWGSCSAANSKRARDRNFRSHAKKRCTASSKIPS